MRTRSGLALSANEVLGHAAGDLRVCGAVGSHVVPKGHAVPRCEAIVRHRAAHRLSQHGHHRELVDFFGPQRHVLDEVGRRVAQSMRRQCLREAAAIKVDQSVWDRRVLERRAGRQREVAGAQRRSPRLQPQQRRHRFPPTARPAWSHAGPSCRSASIDVAASRRRPQTPPEQRLWRLEGPWRATRKRPNPLHCKGQPLEGRSYGLL